MAIRFAESDVRGMGRGATGVKGIDLEETDEVVAMEVLESGAGILTVTEKGFGKRTDTDEYRRQNRGGKGLITIKTTDRNGKVAGAVQVTERDEVMLVTSGGTLIRVRAGEISMVGRNTQGVKLIAVEEGERVVSVTKIAEREDVETDPSTMELREAGLPPVSESEGGEPEVAPAVETEDGTKPDGEDGEES